MKRSFLFAAFMLLATSTLLAQAKFDVQHYGLGMTFDLKKGKLFLQELITLERLDNGNQIALDLIAKGNDGYGMEVISVKYMKDPIPWHQDSSHLYIDISTITEYREMTFLIELRGIPKDGLIIGNNKFNDPTIFADNWPNRAKNWYACHDHPSDKAMYSFDVFVPKDFEVVANGRLSYDTPIQKGKKKWWSYVILEPIATKVAVVGIADFLVKEIAKIDDMTISAAVYPKDSIKATASFSCAADILTYYSNKIGPYPYLDLMNVQSTTRYGGMENAGCIFYDEQALNNDKRSTHLVAHEIAHQWFGNCVTESDWPHLWLSEGFATYLTNLYIQKTEGDLAFKAQMAQDRSRVVRFYQQFKKPLVDTLTTDLNALLNPNAYQKGAWILHMLRLQIGEEPFFKGLQAYFNTYQHGNASTEDFCKVMLAQVEGEFKIDLRYFLDQWLYQSGHPIIAANFRENEGQVFLDIEQIQEAFFVFPLLVSIYQNGQLVVQKNLIINDRNASFLLPELTSIANCTYVLDPKVSLLFEEYH